MKSTFLWLFAALFWACNSPAPPVKDVYTAPAGKRMATVENGNTEAVTEQKIIRSGSVRFKTEQPDETARLIREKLKVYGGMLIDEQRQIIRISRSEKEINYRMEVKIPADKLDAFIKELDAIAGEYDFKNIRSQDVTERYIDLKARLKAKKALHQRLTELLKQARNVDEIIRLEKELARLQAEIESLEGQLRYLNDRTAYSRLDIEFYKRIITSPRFFARLGDAFKNGWIIFQQFLLALTNLWIFILIGFIVWFLWRRRRT